MERPDAGECRRHTNFMSTYETDYNTTFDREKNGLADLETYTPRLITAMKQTLTQLEKTDLQSSQ